MASWGKSCACAFTSCTQTRSGCHSLVSRARESRRRRTELTFQLTMRKAGPRGKGMRVGRGLYPSGALACRESCRKKVNARPGEDRAFEQFLSESFMVGETTRDDRGPCGLDHCMEVNWRSSTGIQGRL